MAQSASQRRNRQRLRRSASDDRVNCCGSEGGAAPIPIDAPEYYFTVDDGKTFFAASSDNIPPFDYDGQQAVLADVFQCDGKKFVGYMERFTPKYHDEVVAHGLTPDAMRFGRELKKPGDAKWFHPSDLRRNGVHRRPLP